MAIYRAVTFCSIVRIYSAVIFSALVFLSRQSISILPWTFNSQPTSQLNINAIALGTLLQVLRFDFQCFFTQVALPNQYVSTSLCYRSPIIAYLDEAATPCSRRVSLWSIACHDRVFLWSSFYLFEKYFLL